MKSSIVFLLSVAIATSASADLLKPATLNITCDPIHESETPTITIVSNEEGSTVKLGDQIIMEGRQLEGGSEGGDPYLQAVDNGYNITLYGGDFQKAFDESSTIESGRAYASVWAQESIHDSMVCSGTYSFR